MAICCPLTNTDRKVPFHVPVSGRSSLTGFACAKLERDHPRDRLDVACMKRDGLVSLDRLRELFEAVAVLLIRHPAIDARQLRAAVMDFCASSD